MLGRFVLLTGLAVSILWAPAAAAAETAYTLSGGETLFSVSRKAQVPVGILQAYNGITDPGRLKTGAVIKVPSWQAVEKGDTLYGIARRLAVPLAALLELNGLSETSRIRPGDRIYAPAGAAVAARAPPAAAAPPPAASSPKPASAAPAAAPIRPGLAWPHAGRREQFTGKFSGLVFYGARGDRIVSATEGEVKSVMPYWGWGKTVIIKSPDGAFFLYAGNEEILVNVGDRVSAGMEIARLGLSPQGGGAKLYFCIQGMKGQYIDPEKYFSRSQA
jgi:murein DD-endopeptidase MepM/ murein hydrolase activator NlpD